MLLILFIGGRWVMERKFWFGKTFGWAEIIAKKHNWGKYV
jgi:hypothetical protein